MARVRSFLAIAVIGAAATEACSLLLPYDDYPGSPRALEAGGDTGPSSSSSSSGSVVEDAGADANDEVDASCAADLKTDPNHCGACGRRCVTGPCESGRCPIESLTPNAQAKVVSLDFETAAETGDALYYTRETGALGRLLLDGGSKVNESSGTNKATGSASLAPNGKIGIFAGDATLWVFRTPTFTTDPAEKIADRPALGPIHYAGALAYFGDDKGIWWAEPRANATVTGVTGPAPVAITSATQRIYWATANGDVMTMRAANPEQPSLVVATGRTKLTSIAVTGTNLYLGHPSQGMIVYAYNTTKLTAVETRVVSLDDVEAIATDGAHVYALDFPGNASTARVIRTNLDGRGVIVLVNQLEPSKGLEVAGDFVYFASGGRIQRTSK